MPRSRPPHFDEALAQLPGFVTIWGRDGRIVWVNAVNYGYRAEDVVGMAGDAAVTPEDRPAWDEAFRRALHGREVVGYAVRVVTPEPPHLVAVGGTLAPVVVRGHVLYVAGLTHHPASRHANVPLYSPAARRLLEALAPAGWLTTAALARLAGERPTSEMRALLRDLADRGAVETNQRLGVRITDAGRASLGDS